MHITFKAGLSNSELVLTQDTVSVTGSGSEFGLIVRVVKVRIGVINLYKVKAIFNTCIQDIYTDRWLPIGRFRFDGG